MVVATSAPPRSLNTWLFAVLCFATAFLWDVAYGILWDRAGGDAHGWIPDWVPLFALFVAPAILCGLLAWGAGQWRRERSGAAVIGAFVCCVMAPLVVFVPFMEFMCLAFNSCFGD